MSTLYLHIGHNKTGSSFIQSSLALSLQGLDGSGIAYPDYSTFKAAAQGLISSGNGALLMNGLQELDSYAGRSVLMSNETLFVWLLKENNAERLHRAAQQIGADRIEILLLTRDPIDHASSVYQQKVKRGGFTGAIDGLYDEYSYPQLVADFLTHPLLGGHPDVAISLRNYSQVSKDLLGVVCDWLGVERGTVQEPPFDVVNRSLTAGELEFQRVVNQSLGASGRLVSDRLCNLLPDIRANKVTAADALQKDMLERLDEAMNFVDTHFPAGEQYDRTIQQTAPAERRLELTNRQIEVIAQGLGREIRELRSQPQVQAAPVCRSCSTPVSEPTTAQVQAAFTARFKPQQGGQPADVLRETALGFESLGDIETALVIMNKALGLRPNGKFIQQKCAEYTKLLSGSN